MLVGEPMLQSLLAVPVRLPTFWMGFPFAVLAVSSFAGGCERYKVLTVSRRSIWLRCYVRALLGSMGDSVQVWLVAVCSGLSCCRWVIVIRPRYHAGLARCANRLLSKRLY
jgi:hypothetical protein